MVRAAAAERLIGRARQIAACTEVPGQTTRLYLCDAMREAHSLLAGWMSAAGLQVRIDAAGNLRGLRRSAANKAARTLLLGSHLDTVPDAGAFDGVLGVLLALAALEELDAEPGMQDLPFDVEVIGFSEEEGVRFGRPFLGSLALLGELDAPLLALTDRDGVSVREALTGFGLGELSLADAVLDPAHTLGFVEVHIEQGPVLEDAGVGLGIVTNIAGQTRAAVSFTGSANHAGTTPMHLRRDALAAASEWIVAVEAEAASVAGLVATVGRVQVQPGAPNVIAGRVTASLDVRHAADGLRLAAVDRIRDTAKAIAARRGIALDFEVLLQGNATAMDEAISRRLAQAAARAGHRTLALTSGAGHDAMVLARVVPAAMLFVRSPGGLSHHPDETVLVEDVEAALQTLVEFLRALGEDGGEGEGGACIS